MFQLIKNTVNKAKFLDLLLQEEKDHFNFLGPNEESHQQLLELINNGYLKLENFVQKEDLQKINLAIQEAGLISQQLSNNPCSTYRIYEVESKVKIVNDVLTSNTRLTNLVNNYFNGKNHFCSTIFQTSYPVHNDTVSTGFGSEGFHFDGYFKRLKAMLLLSDVNIENGPLTYVPKSNQLNSFNKLEKMKDHYLGKAIFNDEIPDHTYYTKSEEEQFKLSEMSISLTGKAGDLIIFETRGLHKAGVIKNGSRKVLVNYYRPADKGKKTSN